MTNEDELLEMMMLGLGSFGDKMDVATSAASARIEAYLKQNSPPDPSKVTSNNPSEPPK